MTRKIGLSVVAAAVLATGAITTVSAEEAGVSNLSWKVNVRPRVEMVTEDNTKDDATAATVKVAPSVKYKAGAVSVNAELNAVVELTDSFNSKNTTDADRLTTSVVADPAQVRPTQAVVGYQAGKTNVSAGRDYLNIDEQRHVGAVGWRQTPQTFDGLFVKDNTLENLNVTFAYITNTNTIFAAEVDNDDNLPENADERPIIALHLAYNVSPAATVSAYKYDIASVSNTVGVKVKGDVPAGDMKVNYKVEYAMQGTASSEHDDVTAPELDSTYTAIAVGVATGGISAGVEIETLGDDADDTLGAFQTPLATKHKFNGWADMFLGTPATGLVDTMVNVGYKDKSVGVIKGVYHMFTDDANGDDLGTELDLLYVKPVNKDLKVLLKYASYTAGDDMFSYVDTTKTWLMVDYNYNN